MNALEELELDPIEIDPRPCEWCGVTIDQHRMVDKGEGPEFFCLPADELDLNELEIRADFIRQIEIAEMVRDMEMNDPRDRWRHTGEPRALSEETPIEPRRYRTPQSTIDAFWYVASLDRPDQLTEWLSQHPRDVETLQRLWEVKHAGA